MEPSKEVETLRRALAHERQISSNMLAKQRETISLLDKVETEFNTTRDALTKELQSLRNEVLALRRSKA